MNSQAMLGPGSGETWNHGECIGESMGIIMNVGLINSCFSFVKLYDIVCVVVICGILIEIVLVI